MPPTTALADCATLVNAVSAAGGRVPDVLSRILDGAALLAGHSAASDPAKVILDAAMAGELDAEHLDALIAQATQRQLIANYMQELRARSKRMFVEQFHRALADGAADEILDGLRPPFDKAAEAVAAARDLIPPTAEAEEFLATARPDALAAWQGLNKHLTVIGQIGSVAAAFGPRNGNFALIKEFALGDGFRLDDRAIWCTDGPNLEADSAIFRQPDRGHRTSAWYRSSLRLNTAAEAVERYRVWAEASWDHAHPIRTVQHQKPDGSVGEFELRNPFAAGTLATG